MAHLTLLLRTSFEILNWSEPDWAPVEYKPKKSSVNFKLFVAEPEKHFQKTKFHVTLKVQAEPEDIEFVRALRQKRITAHPSLNYTLPLVRADKVVIDADGRVGEFGFRRRWLPTRLYNLLCKSESELLTEADRFLGALRWVEGLSNVPTIAELNTWIGWRPIRTKQFHHVPIQNEATSGNGVPTLRKNIDLRKRLETVWSPSVGIEPLGHSLLHEAQRASERDPRAALLMCASALEAGLKEHISERVPEAEWMVLNMPSPPMHKILKQYLPQLYPNVNGLQWSDWKNQFSDIQKLIETRNLLAHKGSFAEEVPLDAYIVATRNVLILCDFLRGNEWAADHMTNDVGKPLGKVTSTGKGIRFILTDPIDY